MNIDTGELIRLREGQEAPEGFVEVPEDLQDEANQLLGCQNETKVDMKKNTPLVNWAKKKETCEDSKEQSAQEQKGINMTDKEIMKNLKYYETTNATVRKNAISTILRQKQEIKRLKEETSKLKSSYKQVKAERSVENESD